RRARALLARARAAAPGAGIVALRRHGRRTRLARGTWRAPPRTLGPPATLLSSPEELGDRRRGARPARVRRRAQPGPPLPRAPGTPWPSRRAERSRRLPRDRGSGFDRRRTQLRAALERGERARAARWLLARPRGGRRPSLPVAARRTGGRRAGADHAHRAR